MLKRKGFTLIEVIVVTSVVSILLSFVIYNFSSHMKKSHRLKAVSGGAQVYNAFMWYYRENKSNLTETMAASFVQKASNYTINSVEIINKENLRANIKYKYEEEAYNAEIYPEFQKYIIKDKGDVAIYP